MDPVARPPIPLLFLPTEFEPEVFDLTEVKPAVEELANQVSIAFHNLVQKRADGKTVQAQHEAWASGLNRAAEDASTAWENAKKAPKVVPVEPLENARLADLLVDNLYYKTFYDTLVAEVKTVKDALSDKTKWAELTHLKDIVAACDSMTTDTTATLNPTTEEAREFVAITAHSFTEHEEIKDPAPLPLVDTVAVPKEYKFRTGDQERTKTSYLGGYYKIAGTVNYLESIAHRLHKLKRDYQDVIKFSSGSGKLLPTDQLLKQCEFVERLLTEHMDVLRSKPHSTHLHAGWYYLKGLVAQLATTKAAIIAFDKMKEGDFGFCAKITERLFTCLYSGNLYALYEAAELVRKSPDKVPTLKEVISRKAVTLLAPTLEESKVAALAFGDQPITVDELSSYLTKGFIQSIFSNCSSAEFKLAVAKLSTTPQFAEALKRSDPLKQLHDHYFRVVKAHAHEKLLSILSLLYTSRPIAINPELLALDRFMRLTQAELELAECKKIDPNVNPRIVYVQGCIERARADWEKESNWKTDPIELFEALKTRFFDLDEKARKEADVALEKTLTQQLKLKPVVMALYFRWLLERFIANIPKEPSNKVAQAINWLTDLVHEVTISESEVRQANSFQKNLAFFFKEYSENPLWKGYFDLHYGPEYMQNAHSAFQKQLPTE